MNVVLILVHYNITKQLKVYCNASPCVVGACLMQVMDGHEGFAAYASCILTSAEANYTQMECEKLAITLPVTSFTHVLFLFFL